MKSNIIVVDGSAYKAIEPVDSYCSLCDLFNKNCSKLPKSYSCIPVDREDNSYVNYKKLKYIPEVNVE